MCPIIHRETNAPKVFSTSCKRLIKKNKKIKSKKTHMLRNLKLSCLFNKKANIVTASARSTTIIASAQLNLATRTITTTTTTSNNSNSNSQNLPVLFTSKRSMYLPPRPKPPDWRDDMITNYKSNVIFCVLAILVSLLSVFLAAWTFLANRIRGDETNSRTGKKIIIIGGGTAGSMAAAAISQLDSDCNITVFDKKRLQMFTPTFPLAAAGHRSYDLRVKGPSSLFASTCWTVTREANLVLQEVVEINPEEKTIVDDTGAKHSYDALVLAAGCELDHSAVGGFYNLDQDRVAVHSGGIRDFLMSSAYGNVLMVRAPAKSDLHRSCEGTWVSTVNTAWKHLKWFGRTGNGLTEVWAITPDQTINDSLPQVHKDKIEEFWKERNINVRTQWKLDHIDRKNQTAYFIDETTGKKEKLPYRMIAVDLQYIPPPLLRKLGENDKKNKNKEKILVNPEGFIPVDHKTLRHKNYPEIFALGDCTDVPVSRSYGAISAQAPVLSHNLIQFLRGRECNAEYNLYSSFHINMSTWRLMWPEVIGNKGQRNEPRAGYWDDSDWKGVKGFAQGFYYQMFLYELSYWFLHLRAQWCAPHWFSWPIYEPGREIEGHPHAMPDHEKMKKQMNNSTAQVVQLSNK